MSCADSVLEKNIVHDQGQAPTKTSPMTVSIEQANLVQADEVANN